MYTRNNHLSDEEILTLLYRGGDVQAEELGHRLSNAIDEVKACEELIDEKSAVDWAIGCFGEHAGEDFHQDVIDQLFEASKMNKAEMIREIKSVMEKLNQYDMNACNEVAAMRADGVQ